jgi:hypothetical protein
MGLGAGFGAFYGSEMSIFHYVGDEEMKEKGSHWVTRRWTRRWIECGWHVQSVLPACRGRARTGASGQAQEKLRSTRNRSDAVAHPVTIDQTHQVVSGCLLELTGR